MTTDAKSISITADKEIDYNQLFPCTPWVDEMYRVKMITPRAGLHYGYACLIIVGADAPVTEAAMQFICNHQLKCGLGEDVIRMYREYDYQSHSLEYVKTDLLPVMRIDNEQFSLPAAILYNCINMATLDGSYPETKRTNIIKAAEILEVSTEVIMGLHSIVEQERLTHRMRHALMRGIVAY